MIPGPIVFRCVVHNELGLAMVPLQRFARQAHDRYEPGKTYALDEIQERSSASHAHFFAAVNDIWRTLPEHLTDRFPSAKALRAHALIETGHYNETRLDAGTNSAALRVAAVMQADTPLAAIVVRGPLVVRRIARSQSYRLMDKGEFQRSKTDVLEFLAKLIGVEASTLSTAAKGTPGRQRVGEAA